MAQRVQIELVDDLTGDVAQETIRFGVDGTEYEIDLTTENADKLRTTLTEYADKGRKASGRRGQGSKSPASSGTALDKAKREETQRIRQWAKDNGHTTSSRGRVSQSIVDAYNEAH
ncbi:Lsr2 family protein [Arthrobacter echini]|uniref:Lsr2 family protein n=2 Tax=Arthrobacter echini TaxID=1529066 RepID=A0A5D0XJF2_9MICC|nr:Lsr2 family protein [Arthrobacter echini]THJ65657.1 Lsr2 family protein [Arthrobacter echini]TYC95961.1 Lsr2 family protein [Arthrobacter echini]